MRNLDEYFSKRKIDYKKLVDYGFRKDGLVYYYSVKILDDDFEVQIEISENKKHSKIIDLFDNGEYVLVDVDDAVRFFCGEC